MYRLSQKNWKRPLNWKQLVPRCSHPECATGSGWTSVLHRVTGFWLNEQEWFCSPAVWKNRSTIICSAISLKITAPRRCAPPCPWAS